LGETPRRDVCAVVELRMIQHRKKRTHAGSVRIACSVNQGFDEFNRIGVSRSAYVRCNRFVLTAILTAWMFPLVSDGSETNNNQASSANVQQSPSPPKAPGGQTPEGKQADSKSQVPPQIVDPNSTSPEAAWTLLREGANSDKFRDRSDAISALTVLDGDRKAIAMIANALDDKEETIRVLAATSLGDIKARRAIPKLKSAMDDKSSQVDFAAAVALWKMGDRSGRDIFYDVLDGERKVKPNLIKSKMQQARMDMHDPKALALIGVNEVSGAFLGPFSMAVSMVEEYAKNGGTPVQALCAQLLASDPSHRTAEELTDALGDKSWAVRAAAARSLAKLDHPAALPQLRDMMENDKSRPARFAAAVAIIRISRHSHQETTPARKAPDPGSR
jgi:HEAT repeats